MSISASSDRLQEALGRFLWNSWTQIGLSGSLEVHERRVLDPEALIVFTLRLGARDPRLFDEALDWLTVNGRAISVQRLANLTRRDPEARAIVDAALDWAGAHEPTLAGWTRRPREPAVVEISPGSIRVGTPDPILLRHGIRWPAVAPSRNSMSVDPHTPAAFAFLLRGFFGVGTRSEIVRVLLTDPRSPTTAQRLARITSFAKRNVHDALSALSEVGAISAEMVGNERQYSIDREGWSSVLAIPADRPWPRFLDWPGLLGAVGGLLTWLGAPERSDESAYMASSGARELISRLQPDLSAAGIRLGSHLNVRGEDFLQSFDDIVNELVTIMEPDTRS